MTVGEGLIVALYHGDPSLAVLPHGRGFTHGPAAVGADAASLGLAVALYLETASPHGRPQAAQLGGAGQGAPAVLPPVAGGFQVL